MLFGKPTRNRPVNQFILSFNHEPSLSAPLLRIILFFFSLIETSCFERWIHSVTWHTSKSIPEQCCRVELCPSSKAEQYQGRADHRDWGRSTESRYWGGLYWLSRLDSIGPSRCRDKCLRLNWCCSDRCVWWSGPWEAARMNEMEYNM